jgi:hypothetical protein
MEHSVPTEEKSQIIKPQSNITFTKYEQSGWEFYHSVHQMFSTTELDQVSDQVGTMTMPEVFYGFNRVYFVCPDKDFILEFSPVDALSLAAFAK